MTNCHTLKDALERVPSIGEPLHSRLHPVESDEHPSAGDLPQCSLACLLESDEYEPTDPAIDVNQAG